jgi:hypothetical protein
MPNRQLSDSRLGGVQPGWSLAVFQLPAWCGNEGISRCSHYDEPETEEITMFRTVIAAAALVTASFAFIPASQAENLGSPGDQTPVATPNTEAQPEAYRGYGYGYRPSYGYNYGYVRPSYGYVAPSYGYGYARPSYGYGYGYGGYRGW